MADDFDTPEQTYVPRWKVRLVIRLEEYGDTGPLKSRVPPKPAKNLKGTSDARAELRAVEDTTFADALNAALANALATGKASKAGLPPNPFSRRWVLMPQGGTPGSTKVGGPQEQTASSDDRTHYIAGIVPKDVQWTQNGVRAADTLRLTLRFVDAPLDPRTVRACAVQFYLGTISVEDHRTQMLGREFGTGGEVLPDTWVDEQGRERSNLRFEGWVDKWDVDITDEGEPTVTLELRDNTQVIIDQEAPPNLMCDAKLAFDESVAKYLAHFPQFVGLAVEYRGVASSAPKLETVFANTAYRPDLGPPPAGAGGASGGTGKLSVWDYLTDCARALGHVIKVEGTAIVIARARTLYSSTVQARPDDPFVGRGGYGHRVFIYGRNVSKIQIGRSYNRQAPSNIEVRCFRPGDKTLLVGRFPAKEEFLAMGLPGDGGADQKWSVHNVSGLKDEAACIAIAKHIYEIVGRNELTMKVSTKNLASLGGGNLDPDIFDMRAGDPFELLVNRDPSGPTVSNIEQYLVVTGRSAQFMMDLGFDEAFARAYEKAYTDAGFQTTFRTKTLSVKCGVEDGVSVEIEGLNYLEIRCDAPVFGVDDGSAASAGRA